MFDQKQQHNTCGLSYTSFIHFIPNWNKGANISQQRYVDVETGSTTNVSRPMSLCFCIWASCILKAVSYRQTGAMYIPNKNANKDLYVLENKYNIREKCSDIFKARV